eukprot:GHVS01100378.1.p1 GENE.GHVS01100378.1~~GHVS01100378.1.p1  ORF type:complete len:286 (+),score=34.07 GHVS01100378.1:184-1041(+)
MPTILLFCLLSWLSSCHARNIFFVLRWPHRSPRPLFGSNDVNLHRFSSPYSSGNDLAGKYSDQISHGIYKRQGGGEKSVNQVALLGRVGREPDIRVMPSGERACNFSLATSEAWTDRMTQEPRVRTEWHRICIYNPALVELAEKLIRKGSRVYISGSLQTKKWMNADGMERSATEVVLSRLRGEFVVLDTPAERQSMSGDFASAPVEGWNNHRDNHGDNHRDNHRGEESNASLLERRRALAEHKDLLGERKEVTQDDTISSRQQLYDRQPTKRAFGEDDVESELL